MGDLPRAVRARPRWGSHSAKEVPGTVRATVEFWADLMADRWTYLADCVRSGSLAGAVQAMERDGMKSRIAVEPQVPGHSSTAALPSTPAKTTTASWTPTILRVSRGGGPGRRRRCVACVDLVGSSWSPRSARGPQGRDGGCCRADERRRVERPLRARGGRSDAGGIRRRGYLRDEARLAHLRGRQRPPHTYQLPQGDGADKLYRLLVLEHVLPSQVQQATRPWRTR